MIKLLAFDLDGTLTQHKTKIDEKNRELLSRLSEKYRLLMVGAGASSRIHKQLDGFPIEIIGNYGMQYGVSEGGEFKLLRDDVSAIPLKEEIEKKVDRLREAHGFTSYVGESVEYHKSGCITIALIGTEAKLEDKLAFDPDKSKRRAIYREVCEAFPDYNVFIGGTSSFDMAPKPYNKYYALDLYCREREIDHGEVLFFGDDFMEGGNDESVFLSDFGFIKIYDYTKLDLAAKPLLEGDE